MITHIVLMKFTDPTDRVEAKTRLDQLPPQIDELSTLTVGLDLVGSDASYDLALVTTHASLDDLRGYQEHPAHVAVAGWLRPRLSSRVVVDHDS